MAANRIQQQSGGRKTIATTTKSDAAGFIAGYTDGVGSGLGDEAVKEG